MQHLIWITPGFPHDEQDSQCIPALQELAKAWPQHTDIRLHIITLHYPYRAVPYRWNGHDVYPCAGNKNKYGRLMKWRRAWQYAQQVMAIHPCSGIHSFWLHDAALLGHWLAKLSKLSHWTTLMGQDARSGNRYRWLLPLSQMQLITLSNFQDEQLWQTTGRRADRIIPWGLPTQQVVDSEKRGIDLLGVGNLTPLKDFASFINVCAKLVCDRPHLKAMILGDGPQREALQAQIDELGLTQQLILKGAVDRETVFAYMQGSRVFLHTSTYESFGMVFLEAVANGMQVVSRPVGWAATDERMITASTINDLVVAVQQALGNPQQNGGRVPSIAQTMKKYLEIWELD